MIEWKPDHDVDGRLRYICKREDAELSYCYLTRYDRYNWTLVHADGIKTIRGSFREARDKAEAMLKL
jgi:hypothetical protein